MSRAAESQNSSTARSGDRHLPNTAPTARHAPTSRWLEDPRLWSASVVLLTCIAFSPLFTADFTNVDDPQTIALDPALNPPTLASLAEFWNPRKPRMDLYVPVTYTVWSGIARLAWLPTPDPTGIQLNPWMFHGANVLLHAMSALVVFQILRLFVPNMPVAAAGALLFALHPVQVEPVGWASGTKDVLCGLFSLIAIWGYLHSARSTISQPTHAHTPDLPKDDPRKPVTPGSPDPGPVHQNASRSIAPSAFTLHPSRFTLHSPPSPWFSYGLATAALILAMLSKPTAVVTPLIAAALDLLLLRRKPTRIARGIVPWMLLTVPVLIEGHLAQPAQHPGDYVVPIFLRPLIAADALAFYLYKLVWPANLGVIYNRNPQAVLSHGWPWWTWTVPAAAAVAVLAPSMIRAIESSERRLRFRSPRRRTAPISAVAIDSSPNATPAAALAVFCLGVLPVLGLIPFDFQQFSTTADHYLYLSMLGPALAAAFALTALWHRRPACDPPSGPTVPTSVPRTIVIPALCIALLAALGLRSFFQARHWQDSFSILEHSIAVNPESPFLYDNLSKAYADANLPDDARHWDEESIRRWPARAAGHLNLASDYRALNRPTEAEAEYQTVLRLDPGCDAARRQLVEIRQQRAAATKPTP